MNIHTIAFSAVLFGAISSIAGVTGTRTQPLLVAGSGRAALVAPDGNVVWDAKNCGNIHRVWLRGDWVQYSNSDLLRVNVKTGARELIYKPCPRDGLFGFEILPNGNLVLGTYANGRPDGSRVTAFEITRDKKIVWTYSATGDKNMMTAFLVDGSAFAR